MCLVNWIKCFCNIFKVHWEFNFSAFRNFRYGDKFIHVVEDAYTNIECKIEIKDLLSDPFTIAWKVCQGCLFSMLLYIIAAEVLASFINPIKGLKEYKNSKIKIVSFADNITIFLKEITCLNMIQVTLQLYEDASSSKKNLSKIQALCIGWCIKK